MGTDYNALDGIFHTNITGDIDVSIRNTKPPVGNSIPKYTLYEYLSHEFILKDIQDQVEEFLELYKNVYNIVLLPVMNGAIWYAGEFIRALRGRAKLKIGSIQINEHSEPTLSKGTLITGNHVIVLDTIVDTGTTWLKVFDHLKQYKPESTHLIALLDRQLSTRGKIVYPRGQVRHVKHRNFLVGFGLDYKGVFRDLPGIYTMMDQSGKILQVGDNHEPNLYRKD